MKTIGESPVLVEKDAHCDECGRIHDLEKCPRCGSWITFGYGMMFGGMGQYAFCNNDDCTWFQKKIEEREDD